MEQKTELGYDTSCQPQGTLNEQRLPIKHATLQRWQTGIGTAGEVIRSELCCLVLRIQTKISFSDVLIYDPHISFGELEFL